MIPRMTSRLVLGPLAVAAVFSSQSVVHANTGTTIEAVKTYACGTVFNTITDADGFLNRMDDIAGYVLGQRYTETSVYASDFRDPDLAGPSANDTFNFDRGVDAISYYAGHGSCNDQTDTACTTTAGCPTLAGLDKVCTRFTESPLTGRCMYSRPRQIVVDDLSGPGCEFIDASTSNLRFGESPNSGAFAGAGTNGGINAAVLSISCGLTPNMAVPQYINAFAGVSSIHTIMPTRRGSDTVDVTNRGKSMADRYIANQNSSVGFGWTDGLNSITGGGSCQFGGGGHGITGCGANMSIAVDTNQSNADWSLYTESWVQLRNESNDPVGQGWMSWRGVCNYDCIAHPWTL